MLTRRAFLAGSAALAASATPAVAGPDRTAARPRPRLARGGRFPQGVMAGQPGRHGATLWVQHARADRPGPLRLEVARDAGFDRVVHRERLQPDEQGFARTRVRSDRLEPGRPYWYRFATADGSSPVGRFKTLRPADSNEPVRIGVFSCQMYFLGYFTGHAALAREDDLDLVVCLGDYIYETYLDAVRKEPRPDGASGGAVTLEEYRTKYAVYRSDPDLRAMHAAHAFLPVWDDHEVVNDYAGDSGPGPDFAQRRKDAYCAWFEAMPVERPERERDRTYRRLPLGRHVDLLALDTRQYREPGRTLLGDAQEAWLLGGLQRSRATWQLLASSVLVMDLDGPGSESLTGASAGSWQAFPEARERLAQAARQVSNVAAVTGDAHAFYAGTVGDAPWAVEFCAGTLAASNAGTSAFETLNPASGPALAAQDRSRNPHLTYSNPSEHGYAIVEARADALDVTFRAVETIQRPRAAIRDLAAFTTPAGETAVHPR